MNLPNNLSRYFDHTILKATATQSDILKLCEEAAEHHFYSVCVNPYWVKTASDYFIENNIVDVAVCTVIGFPLGANSTEIKMSEIINAKADGASELDIVMNIGLLKSGDIQAVLSELTEAKKQCGDNILKVIIETCYLTEEEKISAINCVKDSGADFVKTSTGFGDGGATIDDIQLMKSIVKDNVKIKASGGVRDLDFTLQLIEAGADRIGASRSVSIMQEANQK